MLAIDNAMAFAAASFLLALAPGPDNLFVLTQAAVHGRNAGWLVTLGLCSGLMIHTCGVALGIAALFQSSTLAFSALKIAGAGYLLYLSWQAFTAPANTTATPAVTLSAAQLYRRGILMNLTNPKVSIFFLAFLPQFAQPEHGAIATQLLVLGGIFIVITLIVFGSIALLAANLGHLLKRSLVAQRWLNRAAGSVFALLALRLALAER